MMIIGEGDFYMKKKNIQTNYYGTYKYIFIKLFCIVKNKLIINAH